LIIVFGNSENQSAGLLDTRANVLLLSGLAEIDQESALKTHF